MSNIDGDVGIDFQLGDFFGLAMFSEIFDGTQSCRTMLTWLWCKTIALL